MSGIEKCELLFDGNEKQIYSTNDPDMVVLHFKDVTTAYGGVKRARFKGIGCVNNKISAILFHALEDAGIKTHFLETFSEREMLCRKIERIDIEVIVHNKVAGTLARKLDMKEGFEPGNVIVDFRYNNPKLGNPLINEDQSVALGMVTYEEAGFMHRTALGANEVLKPLMCAVGIDLVDFKVEFGRASDGSLIVSDELSPDRCRLWDMETGEKLDKDRFRHDLADIFKGYDEVLRRLENR